MEEEVVDHFEFEVPSDRTDEQQVEDMVDWFSDEEAQGTYKAKVAEVTSKADKATRKIADLTTASESHPLTNYHLNEQLRLLIDCTLDLVYERGSAEQIAAVVADLRRAIYPLTLSDDAYPLKADNPDYYGEVKESITSIFERARDRHGKRTWMELANDFGFSDSMLRRYRKNPETMPRTVVMQLGTLAGMTIEEMQYVAVGRWKAKDIAPQLKATFGYVASCDVLEPGDVMVLYQLVDDDTRKAITHSIKAWARSRRLVDDDDE